MIYLSDTIFVIGYLLLKRLITWMHLTNADAYFVSKKATGWIVFLYVTMAMYLTPLHTEFQFAIAFGGGIVIKFVFDTIFKNNKNENRY